MKVREIKESPVTQGTDETIVYTLTTTPWASDPTSPSAKIFSFIDDVYADVTSTNMTGAASAVGDVITLPAIGSLVVDTRYRVEVQFTVSGNTFESYAWIYAER
jgi:hypothetical protein